MGHQKYECAICKDTELILGKDEKGYDVATFCECKERKAWKCRFKQSMTSDEFQKANFENYVTNTRYQFEMKKMALDYVNLFCIVTGGRRPNLG